MADLKEAAEKKYKSRMRKFKKVVKNDEEKAKFFPQLGASFEVFLPPTKKSDTSNDSILLYCDPDGTVVGGEYSYDEGEEFESMDIPEKDLKVLIDAFKDFKLEFHDED